MTAQRNPRRPPRLQIDDLATPAAWLDREHRVLSLNRALAIRLDNPPSDGVGTALADLVLAAGGEADGLVGTTYRFGDPAMAGPVWLRLDLEPVAETLLALLTDVTAERQALQDLRESYAARDRLLIDAQVGAWRYDPDADAYHFSRALALGHGDTMEPVSSGTLARIQHRADRPKDAAVRQRLTTEGGSDEAEVRYLTGGGEWTHLRVHYRSGRQLPSGRYEMLGLSQDVTPLASARDEANLSAQRLRLALQAANAGVFDYDYRRKRFWLSPEYRSLIGPQAVALGLHDPLAVFHPDDRPIVAAVRGGAGRGGPDAADVRVLAATGERWMRFYLEVERDEDGKATRAVGLMLDIHQQKLQELALDEARRAAEAATAAKSDFLAAVSHEIRTPMNGIVGVLNLLCRENLSTEGAGLLQEALDCSAMLSQLVNDVLDFSKIEAGKLELSPVAADPAQVAASVVSLLAAQAEAKGLYLRVSPPAIGYASVDALRLRQCLFNVIGNAVKFTERGGVEVSLGFEGEGENRRLRCQVRDTGVGVPEVAKSTVFDRFQQADSGTTRRFGGTGLGLTISRSLARMMGGDMDFESREGVGSTFWFEILAPEAEAPASSAPDHFADAPLEGLRILVVDDNATNRLIGVKSVEALGAAAEAATGGPEAIEAMRLGGFDLVLMDINMPGMDGLEATRRIRALPAPAGHAPIIAMTADVMGRHRALYDAAGMNGMVPKPFSPAQLIAEVMRVAAATPDDPAEERVAS